MVHCLTCYVCTYVQLVMNNFLIIFEDRKIDLSLKKIMNFKFFIPIMSLQIFNISNLDYLTAEFKVLNILGLLHWVAKI